MAETDLAPAPFTHKLGLSAEARASIRGRLESLGVRELPYPFASAMSVVSDCDGANRAHYEAYTQSFADLGLDFGDSTWLHWNNQTGFGWAGGLGFYSHAYTRGLTHEAAWLARTRTFAESIAGFHSGHIDHFHSLFRDGPRVVVVKCDQPDGALVELSPGPFQIGGMWRSEDLHLFGLLIDGDCQDASVVGEGGIEMACTRRLTPPRPGQTLLVFPFDPERENVALRISAVTRIKLFFARDVRRVILLSCYSELLLERIAHLRTFNVEMSLITEHSGLYFRARARAGKDDDVVSELVNSQEGPLPAVFGAVSDHDGLVVSTDADDPASVCRVLPDLFDVGLRFLMPSASNGFDGLDILTVVSPTPTRAGGGGYWARRTTPLGLDPHRVSFQETFALRLRKALQEADRQPGQVWPIYTHLGAFQRGSAGPPPIPEPYFDAADMYALQDRVLGMTGHGERMWLARASTLYDYCLMIREISDHVERHGDNIEIESWRDRILGKTLPCSPAQLYGLTFFVDDAATATVRLNGEVVDTVARNRADETGRQSVTILESEIRSIVFDQLSPLRNYPDEAEILGDCIWRDGELVIDGSVTIPMHGWSASAAQAFVVDAQGTFGIRLRTDGGGSFYFGDARWADSADEASYAFSKQDGGRFVVPFHDLQWRAATGGHVPSHPLASITFMGNARFARAALLRPRATTLSRTGFCVVGRVANFEPGQTVLLGERRETVDQRGWFCFPQTPRGIYRLTSNDRCDRRGPLVEIGSDVANIVLNRAI